jgi:hypothetical protein|tara:strand:- start:279 stop:470 length:192 start_codon:yes stop_codon:yes gene_type:complete
LKGEKAMNTKSWKDIKNVVYGKKGAPRRDELDRDFQSFKIGLLLKKDKEDKQLAELVDKKHGN